MGIEKRHRTLQELASNLQRRQRVIGLGSAEKRGKNKYRIRFNIGIDPATGEYLRSPWRTVYDIKNKTDLRIAMENYKRELNEDALDASKNMTVGEYAWKFFEMRSFMNLSPLTLKRESNEIRQIDELFGSIKLVDLGPHTIKKTYARVREEQKLSEFALHAMHTKFKQILQEAVEDGFIERNPLQEDLSTAPRRERARAPIA